MENTNENAQQEVVTEETKKENIFKRGAKWVKGHRGVVAGAGVGLLAAAAAVAKIVAGKNGDEPIEFDETAETIETDVPEE